MKTKADELRRERDELKMRLCCDFSDRASSDGWTRLWADRIVAIEKELMALAARAGTDARRHARNRR